MMNRKGLILAFCAFLMAAGQAGAAEVSMKITKKYLNLPIAHSVDRARMTFSVDGKEERSFVVRIAPDAPEYWVFADVSPYKGKTIKISYAGNPGGLGNIYQSDEPDGHETMYKEENRPRLHFTARRGWINDPNGLIYYDGEYHLYYQHNPYERDWENMTWGHAVSKDLVHWKELAPALYPDKLGTMFSGSAVIDYNNTAGWNKGKNPAMVVAYTAAAPDRQTQCIAYSLDKGRTFTKYEGNPVIDSKDKWGSVDTRDPKVFWYAPNKEWVMALNERDGHSIYTSANLKDWKFESHITGFWECPELFELPVDGNKANKKWVMYGASGTYMIGSFDGKKFTPEAGKYYYTTGTFYAAQTYGNIPASDGRRIQIGWSRMSHPGMPFNGQMLLPTELTLRTTKNGVRLFSNPIKEVDGLQTLLVSKDNIRAGEGNEILRQYSDSAALRIKLTLKLSHATDAGLNLYGQNILRYDLNPNTVNGVFYSPEDMTSMEISADIIVDRTSFEVFVDGGAYSFSMERRPHGNNKEGYRFYGNNIEIRKLEVYSMKSVWE